LANKSSNARRILETLLIQLRDRGLPVERDGIVLIANGVSTRELSNQLRVLVSQP